MANMQGGAQDEKIICRLFLRRRCSRFNSCPFSHPQYNLNPESSTVSWLNICDDFQRGVCLKQDCRYFHITMEEEEAFRLSKDVSPTLLEQAMRKALLFEVALTGTMATCKDFLRSGCSVPMCPYRHISRAEFATEVLDTLQNEFEVLFGPSGTDIPGSEELLMAPTSNRNSPPLLNPVMGQGQMAGNRETPMEGMGQGHMAGNRETPMQGMGLGHLDENRETPEKKMRRLLSENEEIYRALDPNQKVQSLEQIRVRLLTLQAALQWKDENDANKGDFVDDGRHPGMAVGNYDYSNSNFEEPSINLLHRSHSRPLQPMFGRNESLQGNSAMERDIYDNVPMDLDQEDNHGDQETNRKIFVGALDKVKTGTDSLRDYFSKFGLVDDAVVINSRGFGFVTFTEPFMAENALRNGPHRIDGKNVNTHYGGRPEQDGNNVNTPYGGWPEQDGNNVNTPYGGRPEQQQGRSVSTDQEDNRGDQENSRKIFVGALDKVKTDTDTLKRYFSRFGVVADAVAVPSRGFGFVTFTEPFMAENALNNGPHKIDGKTVDAKYTGHSAQQQGRSDSTENSCAKRLFIGGLTDATPDNVVKEYFSGYGRIIRLEQMRDQKPKLRRFCYIMFEEEVAGLRALANCPHKINGVPVTVAKAKRGDIPKDVSSKEDDVGDGSEETDQVYVGGLSSITTDHALKKYFGRFGKVKRAWVHCDFGAPKGYGFVKFFDPYFVDYVTANGPHEIDGCIVDVKKPFRKTKGDSNSRDSRGGGGSRDSRGGGARKPSQRSRDDNEPKSSSTGSGCSRKLYIGNLDLDTTKISLYEHFHKYGVIEETIVKNDPSRYSRAFGFVTYAEEHSARAAMKDGPHKVDGSIVDVQVKLSKGKEEENSRESGARKPNKRSRDNSEPKTFGAGPCKLYVGNLVSSATEETLYEYFGKYGEVTEAEVQIKNKNRIYGYGFVTFAEERSAQELIEDGEHEIGGFILNIEVVPNTNPKNSSDSSAPRTNDGYSREDQARKWNHSSRDDNDTKSSNTEVEPCKILVRNIDSDTTEGSLYDYFCKYGEITDVEVRTRAMFAIITFTEEFSVLEAMEDGPHEIDGRIVVIDRVYTSGKDDNSEEGGARRRQWSGDTIEPKMSNRMDKGNKMFVGNLPKMIVKEEIEDYFCKYGEIESVYRPIDAQGKIRGYIFITFADEMSVQLVLEDDPHKLKGNKLRIGLAKDQEDKKGQQSSSQTSASLREADKGKAKKKYLY